MSGETGHKAYLALRAKMTAGQAELLDCALELYKAGATVIYATTGRSVPETPEGAEKPPQETEEEAAVRTLCTAGVLAEAYSAIFWRLNALLRRKFGREKVSVEETEAEWRRYFDWIVKADIRPPITTEGPTGREVTYPFELVHRIATQAQKNFRSYRRETKCLGHGA